MTLIEFREARDAICRPGSNDIAAINETVEGMTPEDMATALTRIAARIGVAQTDLDQLLAPPEVAEFVTADNARRERKNSPSSAACHCLGQRSECC